MRKACGGRVRNADSVGPEYIHIFPDLKAGFEGVRYEADTDAYVRFDQGQHVAETSLRTQDADMFLETHIFTFARTSAEFLRQRLLFLCPNR